MTRPILKILFLLLITTACTQAQILKGHILNGNTGEVVENAEVYILGVDRVYDTPHGEYRLDLSKGEPIPFGAEVTIYIRHSKYGFHDETITLPQSLEEDITIFPDNVTKIIGTVYDENTQQPIKGIKVALVLEESTTEDNVLIEETDEYGGYTFFIKKSLIQNQRYVTVKFLDDTDRYAFLEDQLNARASEKVYLKRKQQEFAHKMPLPPSNSSCVSFNRPKSKNGKTTLALVINADASYKSTISQAFRKRFSKLNYYVQTNLLKLTCEQQLLSNNFNENLGYFADYILLVSHDTKQQQVQDQYGVAIDWSQTLEISVLDASDMAELTIESPFVNNVYSTDGDDRSKIQLLLKDELATTISKLDFNF